MSKSEPVRCRSARAREYFSEVENFAQRPRRNAARSLRGSREFLHFSRRFYELGDVVEAFRLCEDQNMPFDAEAGNRLRSWRGKRPRLRLV